MTLTAKAIEAARNRVAIVPNGQGWVVHTWSPRHHATFVSHSMTHAAAVNYAKEARIRQALHLLGDADADEGAAILAQRRGTWTTLLRDYLR